MRYIQYLTIILLCLLCGTLISFSYERIDPALLDDSNNWDDVKNIVVTQSVNWDDVSKLNLYDYEAPTEISFQGANWDEVGRLSWDSGTFKFEGDANESAKIFMEYVGLNLDKYCVEKERNASRI